MKTGVRIASREEWPDILARFPERTVFHSLPWLDALSASRGGRLVLCIAEKQTRPVAAWPLLELHKGPLRILGSPLPGSATTYMGPLFDGTTDTAPILEAFFANDVIRRHSYFACRAIDRCQHVDLFPFGFSRIQRFETYRLDLRAGQDHVWNTMRGECRNRVRRAERVGVEVRFETNGDFIPDFWDMSVQTFARAGVMPTHDERMTREIWERLYPSDRIIALSAFQKGRRLATLVLSCDDHTMYYWGGASLPEFRNVPSHNLLHWEAIREAIRRGLEGYDLVGTKGNWGRFKKSFGAEAVNTATHWERTSSPLLGVVKRMYERYRRARLGIGESPHQPEAPEAA